MTLTRPCLASAISLGRSGETLRYGKLWDWGFAIMFLIKTNSFGIPTVTYKYLNCPSPPPSRNVGAPYFYCAAPTINRGLPSLRVSGSTWCWPCSGHGWRRVLALRPEWWGTALPEKAWMKYSFPLLVRLRSPWRLTVDCKDIDSKLSAHCQHLV